MIKFLFMDVVLVSFPAASSRLAIKTIEQGVKYIQSNGIVLVSLLTLIIFHTLF